MRRRETAAINRRISLNSLLISLFLNLVLFLVLSLFREHVEPQANDALAVGFVSLPRTHVQRRSLDLPSKQMSASVPRDMEASAVRARLTREIAPMQSESVVAVSIDPTSSREPGTPKSSVISRRPSISPISSPVGALRRGNGVPSRLARRESGGQIGPAGRGITPRQPMAGLSGTGKNLGGYYTMKLSY